MELHGVAVQLVGDGPPDSRLPDGQPKLVEAHMDHSAQRKLNIGGH